MDIILNKCRKKTLDYQYWYGCRLILKGLKTAIFIVRTLKVFTNSASKFQHHMSPIYWSISIVLDNVWGGGAFVPYQTQCWVTVFNIQTHPKLQLPSFGLTVFHVFRVRPPQFTSIVVTVFHKFEVTPLQLPSMIVYVFYKFEMRLPQLTSILVFSISLK